MKKLVTTIALLAICSSSAFAANAVRISQVYGGGGGSTGTYIKDYVELFNSSGSAVDLSNWALEYGSATGTWGSAATNYFVFPAGASIAPCSYLLVETSTPGSAGVALPVAADYSTTNMSMSATNGKVGLFSALNAGVACGSEAAGTLIDKVAWGTANCPEVTATPGLSSTEVIVRGGAGMTDTDNNSADFAKVVAGSVPLHNAGSGPNTQCLATPTSPKTWGSIKSQYR